MLIGKFYGGKEASRPAPPGYLTCRCYTGADPEVWRRGASSQAIKDFDDYTIDKPMQKSGHFSHILQKSGESPLWWDGKKD